MASVRTVQFSVKVLIYHDDSTKEWVAHALEMDLIGTGENQQAACKELEDAIESQLGFALEQNDRSIALHRAPDEYFKRWETAHRNRLRAFLGGDEPAVLEGVVAHYWEYSKREIDRLSRGVAASRHSGNRCQSHLNTVK